MQHSITETWEFFTFIIVTYTSI